MDKPTALPDLKSAIEIHEGSPYDTTRMTDDYLVRRDGHVFAGEHLLIDFWGGSRLDDIEFVDLPCGMPPKRQMQPYCIFTCTNLVAKGGYPVSLCSPRSRH